MVRYFDSSRGRALGHSSKATPLTVIDLFAGAGGISEGFRQAGYRVLGGIDSDPDAAATYALNFPDAQVIVGDIREPEVHASVLEVARHATVIVGGPPCQAFSQMRNHTRMIDDPRNALYREFVTMVRAAVPSAFVMENVTGIDQMGVREQIRDDLALDGEYLVQAQVLNAADFGVPQTRKRLLFIGVHRSLGIAPPVLHGSGATSVVSLARCTPSTGCYTVVADEQLWAQGLGRALADPDDLTAVTVSDA